MGLLFPFDGRILIFYFLLSVMEGVVRSLRSVPQSGGEQNMLFPVLSVTEEYCCGDRGILSGKDTDQVYLDFDARRVHYMFHGAAGFTAKLRYLAL